MFVTLSRVDAAVVVAAAAIVVIILIVLVLVSVVVVVGTDLINDAADSEVQRFSLWGPKRFAVIKGRQRFPCARARSLLFIENSSHRHRHPAPATTVATTVTSTKALPPTAPSYHRSLSLS